jgi:glycosyltransferase involved in cell wall biosynthesis
MQDWDLILRFTEESPPRALPVLGTRYYAGRPDSISTRESQYHSQATILRKRQLPVARLKVLYALWHYPQLSESYVETEIRYMQHRGVDVEVWSEVAATTSPYPTTVPIHHGTLAEAIEQVRPDVVHVHWLIQALKYADIVRAAGLSLTVRGHGFEVTSDTITSLEQHPGVSAIYLFPQFAGENLQLRPKIRPMTACFNPKLYAPAAGKDPRLVVRVACALASKDLQSFIHLAQRFPDHHFVLAIVKAQGLERYVDEVVALNESLGSPVDIRVNVSFPQVAALVRRAGIYLHTHGVVAPFGMPISIAEAMATGCYLIARRCPPAEAYVGPAGRCYDTLDEAEALVRETVTWNDDRWRQARRAAVDHAYRHYVDSAVLPPLVEQWMQMAGKDGCETREHSLRHSTPPSSIRICA